MFSSRWKQSMVAVSLFCASFVMQSSRTEAELLLPQPSPRAKVVQHVGVTKVAVTYFSPAARKRVIWGGLVPYDKLWRTGANGATKLYLGHDATVGGVKVKAGKYAIFTTPGKTTWSVMLNTNYKTGGTRGYKESNNVAVFQAKPLAGAARERLTFLFENTTDHSTDLCLEWAGVKVVIPIQVDTKALAEANIDKALKQGWRPYFMAARYYYSIADYKNAVAYIDQSIALQSNWWNFWTKAQILGKQNQLLEAIKHGQAAQTMGANDAIFKTFFADSAAKAIAQWSAELARQNAAAAPAKR